MHATLEKFYLSVLDYAGLEYTNGTIADKRAEIKSMSVDNKPLTLPYQDNLARPEGRHIFHPLNENYVSPETVFLGLYKERLVLELNLRVAAAMMGILSIATNVELQRRVKSEALMRIITSVGEVKPKTSENFVGLVKHLQKKYNEAFIFDLHVKKNGKIGDTSYAATGKVVFTLHRLLQEGLEDSRDGYKVDGRSSYKEDILVYLSILEGLFPGLGDAATYAVGTDIKTFRYFNALLLSSYQVGARVNEIAQMLAEVKDGGIDAADMMSDLTWETVLPELYKLTDVIRLIPNQTNVSAEVKRSQHREPAEAKHAPPPTASLTPPSFNPHAVSSAGAPPAPPPVQQQHPQANHHHSAPQAPAQLTPEELVQRTMQMPYGGGYMPQMYPQPAGYPQQGYAMPMQGYPQAAMQQTPLQHMPPSQGYYPQPGYQQPGYPPPGYVQMPPGAYPQGYAQPAPGMYPTQQRGISVDPRFMS